MRVTLQGDSGGLGLGYVDINFVSFGGYPETELSQHAQSDTTRITL